jgi:hypothetical protein
VADLAYRPRLATHRLGLPPAGGDRPSRFAFSLAKAGSTLLYNMLSALAPKAGLVYFSPEDALFAANVGANQRPADIGDVFRPTGYCYGGFRQYPAYPVPQPAGSRAVFLMRDPRDMAVSLYFSLLKSHALPPAPGRRAGKDGARAAMLKERERMAEITIDQFVTRNAPIQYRRMMEGYVAQGFLWRPDVALFRYEDVVFDKARWLREICRWFEWDIAAADIDAVASRFDERPATPRPDQHVRAVTPGDHRHQLTDASIRFLNQSFAEYMRWFGYE